MAAGKHKRVANQRFGIVDVILFIVLTLWALIIIIPFFNVIATSLTGQKEYMESTLLLWPKQIDWRNYQTIFSDARLLTGFKTTLTFVALGVPLGVFMASSVAYALSRRGWPGRKLFFYIILFTMLFHGGIVPLYLLVKQLQLTNTIWSVVLTGGLNTFYMILLYNYFQSLPDSLVEAARLDGAGEWTILFKVVLPLSKPILATVVLFLAVDKWNEWFNPMIFIRSSNWKPLQLVLRSIVMDSQVTDSSSLVDTGERLFSMGIKMATVIVTMVPIMCVFPFLQKHFAKGIMVGAIKS